MKRRRRVVHVHSNTSEILAAIVVADIWLSARRASPLLLLLLLLYGSSGAIIESDDDDDRRRDKSLLLRLMTRRAEYTLRVAGVFGHYIIRPVYFVSLFAHALSSDGGVFWRKKKD